MEAFHAAQAMWGELLAERSDPLLRSFEIAAVGGCMLAEDTAEHREIFGPDGEAVVYFRNAREAAERAKGLLADSAERARLSAGVRQKISRGAHTYRDRAVSILEVALRIRHKNWVDRSAAR